MTPDRLDERLEDWAEGRTAPTPRPADSRRLAAVVAGRARERAAARRRIGVVAAAAAVLAAGLGVALAVQRTRAPQPWTPEVTYREGTAEEPRDGTLAVPGEGRLVARLGNDMVGLGPASSVHVEHARGGLTRLQLEAGTLVADVHPRDGRRARFEVVSGAYLVSVLGTRFLVERPEAGGLQVVVRDGVVHVSGAAGEHCIEAGYRLTVDDLGEATLEPVEPSIERLTALLSAVPEPPPPIPVPTPRRGDDDGTEGPTKPDADAIRGETAAPPEVSSPTLDELRLRLLDGELEQTTAELEARLAEDPADADAWVLLATARRKAGDPAGAVSAWRQVTARGEPAAANRARYEAALLLQELPGGHAEAVALLEALVASPEGVESLGAEIRLHLAESLIAEGRAEEAWPVLEGVTRDYPGTGPAMAARELLGERGL